MCAQVFALNQFGDIYIYMRLFEKWCVTSLHGYAEVTDVYLEVVLYYYLYLIITNFIFIKNYSKMNIILM
jgi:hypothetical protein